MKHTLYPNIAKMLTPQALSELTGQPVISVQCQPFQANYAKSGSRLLIVETNDGQGARYVVKRISMEWDWLMRATDDRLCRSVTLWQQGWLDRLPPEIEHGIIACSLDDTGWAILMRDVAEVLLPYARFSPVDNQIYLNAMAALHAAFFDLPELANPNLGLGELARAYTMFSPQTGQQEAGGQDEVPQRLQEGWDLVQTLVEPDVGQIVQELLHNSRPLCQALNRYPKTLIHGDWRHANQGLLRNEHTRVVLLDWALATLAPPAVEIARYLGTNSALLPVSKEEAIEIYRQRFAEHLGNRFDCSWWQPQLELGLLGGFIQDGWAIALKATRWNITEGQREHWQADLQWWSERVRAGVRWL
jgi:hypothetical protein